MQEHMHFNVGAHVRMWRKERGLLQKELADMARMNMTQLWALEKGRFSPSIRSLERIANALGISLPRLLSTPADCETMRLENNTINELEAQPEHSFSCFEVIKSSETCPFKLSDTARADLLSAINSAREFESSHSALMPTNLPLSMQASTSEAGAEQLAYALRAHLDIGSAIVHDTIPLFESHGVRVLDAKLPDKPGTVSFYDVRSGNFTVFIAEQFKSKPWRRDFLLLAEIGRAFIFTHRGQVPYRETSRSSRFAHHFAATFLQPEAAVRSAVYNLNVKPDEWTYELLLRMKERFGVSAQLFAIRLKELALITRQKFSEFDALIKKHYKANNYEEPMAKDRRHGRAFDLASMQAPRRRGRRAAERRR